MGKRSPERWRRLKERMRERAKTAYFWLALLALSALSALLLWVAFGSEDYCKGDGMCWLLGVTDKTEAIKLLGFAIAGVMASWGVVAANRRSEPWPSRPTPPPSRPRPPTARPRPPTARPRPPTARPRPPKPATANGPLRTGWSIWAAKSPPCAKAAPTPCSTWPWKTRGCARPSPASSARTSGKPPATRTTKNRTRTNPSTEMQSLLRLLFTTETVDEGRLERFWEGITPDLNGGYFCGVKLESTHFRRAK